VSSPTGFVVVDTNVIVYSVVRDPIAELFAPYLLGNTGLISFHSVAELRFIGYRRQWGARTFRRLEETLERLTLVQPYEHVIEEWAQLMYRQTRMGSRIESDDAWVAATALALGHPVVTNDRKDFERIEGLQLLPP
jgi:tRNA(fMet)-specific endonuclease VapC